ncbi:MAG: hypothetical protein LBQ73_03025 [Tannerellaceae bacterium]|jgi:hypothetical protein|nr:hypothetical protein [Tannerellaceae bacterium]
MACSELFLLLHESGAQTRFINQSEICVDENTEMEYLNRLRFCVKYVQTENYEGFYDSRNIQSHLYQFQELEDYYPCNPTMVLRDILKEWDNWRDLAHSKGDYLIFDSEKMTDHIFCEIAQRQHENPENSYLLLSHEAVSIEKEIEVMINREKIKIALRPLDKTHEWFSLNRKPERRYHPSPKHGENGRGNWRDAAKLLCSHEEAGEILHKALLKTIKYCIFTTQKMHPISFSEKKENGRETLIMPTMLKEIISTSR